MCKDTILLVAHIGAFNEVSDAYAEACRTNRGTAYGVELRTLAAAHGALALRFEARLRELGGHAPSRPGGGLVDVVTLAGEPHTGVVEVLRSENLLIEDLEATHRATGLSEDTRRLVQTSLFRVRAHAHRVETFRATL